MTTALWTIGVVVFGLICGALGYFAREIFGDGRSAKREVVQRAVHAPAPAERVSEDESIEDMALREKLSAMMEETDMDTASASDDEVIHLASDAEIQGNNDADLQIVEGIGPKIEQMLKMNGITSRTELASTSSSELRAILHNAGPEFQMHDPSTWSYQARLAVEGRWAELNEYQDFLAGGREV